MVRSFRFYLGAAFCCVLCQCLGESVDSSALDSSSSSASSRFLRFIKEDRFSGRLETAIVSYGHPKGIRVDLIAAVHIADPEYYRTLQGIFTFYDALLYELVAPEGQKPVKRAGTDSILSRFQHTLCTALDLTFQLEAIDYHRPNFVHADLSPRRLAKVWQDEGGSFVNLFFRVLSAQMEAMKEGMGRHMTPDAILDALRSKDRAKRLKFLVAQEFEQMEIMVAALESGKEGDNFILLGARNKAAIEVLEKQMKKGRKRIGIFYGGAHMPDFETRLERDLGFRKKGQEWLTAWNIHQEKDENDK